VGFYSPFSMKRTLLVNIIAYFFIFLFLYTGASKLMDVHVFKEQLTSSPLLGPLAGIITWALPIGEILLAIALFIPSLQLKGLYATLILMGFFTVYVTVILFMDSHLSCSCGGIIEELSPKEHVLFNSACVVLSCIGIAVARRKEPTIGFKRFAGSSAIGLFLLIGWTLFTAFSTPSMIKTGMEGRLLPSFDLLLADSTTLNTDKIPTGKPMIVIGFSPTCTHCQAETQNLLQRMDSLKNTRILFITPFPFDQMKVFYRYFKLARYPNITMGRDSQDYFLKYFKAQGVPYTTIFDSKKRLKQVIVKEARISDIVQAAVE